jgi:hypothetical protein
MIQYITVPAPSTGGGFDLTLAQSATRSVFLSSSAVFSATTDTAGVTLTNAEWYEDGKLIGTGLTLPYTASNFLGDLTIECVASDGTSAASGSFTHQVVGIIYDHVKPKGSFPDISTLVSDGDEKIVIQTAVFETGSNYLGFEVAGNHTVDWGDGVVENQNSGQVIGHYYTASAFPASSGSDRGYKIATCTITGNSANLTQFELGVRNPSSNLGRGIAGMPCNAIDVRMAGGNFNNINVSVSNVRLPLLERVEFVGDMSSTTSTMKVNNLPSLKFFRMPRPRSTGTYSFSNNENLLACTIGNTDYKQDLQNVDDGTSLFTTNTSMLHYDGPEGILSSSNMTDIRSMFANNFSLVNIGNLSFPEATQADNFLDNCSNLNKVGNTTEFFDFSKVVDANHFFAFTKGFSGEHFPKTLAFPAATDVNSMFEQSGIIDLFPTASFCEAATNMSSFFSTCRTIKRVGTIKTPNVTTFNACFTNANALQELGFTTYGSVTTGGSQIFSSPRLKNPTHFDFTSLTNFNNIFKQSNIINDYQTPVSVSMHSGTSARELFNAADQIKSTYITGSADVTDWYRAFRSNTQLARLEIVGINSSATFSQTFDAADSLQELKAPGIAEDLDLSGCHGLTAESLNLIFTDLATVGSSGANAKTIDVRNTVGASSCNTSIATSKGWQVTTS